MRLFGLRAERSARAQPACFLKRPDVTRQHLWPGKPAAVTPACLSTAADRAVSLSPIAPNSSGLVAAGRKPWTLQGPDGLRVAKCRLQIKADLLYS